jgi:hypothetical protein
MANCMLGFPNRADSAVLSGGAWVPTLSVSNLTDREIGLLARTTSAAPASSIIVIDLGASTKVQAISLRNHNLTLKARYRIVGSMTADFSVLSYDSGWADVWPEVYPWGSLEWEDDNWWSGKYTKEETEGYITELDHLLPQIKALRYWRIELSDPKNPAGFIEAGRLFIGPVWQPKINMAYGASLAWETSTTASAALGGAEYFQRRTPYRVGKFSLDFMEQDEAFSKAFEIQRRAGVDQEVLYIHDPADTVHSLRRRFIGRLRTLNPIEFPSVDIHTAAFEVKELL